MSNRTGIEYTPQKKALSFPGQGAICNFALPHEIPEKTRDQLERIIRATGDPHAKITARYQLALLLDKDGAYPQAFEQARLAGQSLLAMNRDLQTAFQALVAPAQEYTPAILQQCAGARLDHRPPAVFLLGFPSSGTALLRAILSAHPRITLIGNSPALSVTKRQLSQSIPGHRTTAQKVACLTPGQARQLRTTYWKTLARSVATGNHSQLIIDANDYHCQHLGLISALFPDARLIFMIRDPRDMCIETFLNPPFKPNHLAAPFLDWNTAVRLYTAAVHHYQRLKESLSCRLFEIRFERLVFDPDTEIRRLLKFTGETWNPRLMGFQNPNEPQLTTSAQFADTIRTAHEERVGRWRNYEEFFETVKTPLATFTDCLNDADWQKKNTVRTA